MCCTDNRSRARQATTDSASGAASGSGSIRSACFPGRRRQPTRCQQQPVRSRQPATAAASRHQRIVLEMSEKVELCACAQHYLLMWASTRHAITKVRYYRKSVMRRVYLGE
jgi:hypothetical protein